MKRIFAIAMFEVKAFFRNFKRRAIMLVLPVIFMGVFAFAFGTSTNDTAIKIDYVKGSNAPLIQALRDAKTSTNKPQYSLKEVSSVAGARTAVQGQDADVGLLVAQSAGQHVPSITLYGTGSNRSVGVAQAQISGIVSQLYQLPTSPVQFKEVSESKDPTGFQLLAPGLVVYGILILMPNIASAFARIRTSKQHLRYYMSATKAYEVVLGNALALLALAIFQTASLLVFAQLFGFHPNGNLLFAFVVAVPTAIFTVAAGVLIGSYMGSEDASTNMGIMLGVILGFLSGSFITVPAVMVSGFDVMKLIPTRHATIAMSNVILYGRGFDSAVNGILVISGAALLLFVVASWVFAVRQFRNVAEY